ncbi:PP2C family protein-serine/threonine phosphatase [Bacillus alkalicellulosilyticus]|uniref:PP2C family protein-serine/threonine phosphatase n=1 Tax=Alkalihalobacterium alkalicellulosilyticum TaxID=1912214 RepID=UPI0009983D56|nr:PP2C family serine/threonine-protein phosphatase [Bacillus alkalicellulosilyticus]
MRVETAQVTDIGTKKKTNQDALLMKTARTPNGLVGLFVVCDGMGGLSQGELASATVIQGMATWFDEQLPLYLKDEAFRERVPALIEDCIRNLHEKIHLYGEAENMKLGTTVTAMFLVYDTYYVAHVGDSRAYCLSNKLTRLTVDQTLVAREIERGNLTEAQAKEHPKRNVLLQCIGASKDIDVVFTTGKVEDGAIYVLCSDGFCNLLSDEELFLHMTTPAVQQEADLTQKITELIDIVKQKQETDNITAMAIKVRL